MKYKGLVLAIDLDGVIHDKAHPIEGKKMGPPLHGAQTAMDELYQARNKLIIFTTMATSESGKQAVIDWLEWYDIDYHEVTAIKPTADIYLDDKAVRFTSWDEALAELTSMGVKVAD